MATVTITPRDNGPYRIVGPIELVDVEGRRIEIDPERPVSLCRCGHSRQKPFCDGSHHRAGFESVVRAEGETGQAAAEPVLPSRRA